ncbi:MAG: lamin tail domain-containing protein [Halodesulfurarchaeum sp.]
MTRGSATTAILVFVVVLAGCSGVSPDTSTTPPLENGTTTPSYVTVTVVEVVDGDTIDIRYQNGSTDTVRLLGVDTPEPNGQNYPGEFEGVPDTEWGKTCLQTEAHDATNATKRIVLHKTVRLVFDPVADRRGSYGRLLAYVYENGETLNYRLVDRGYARVYDSEFTKSDQFYAAEAEAQQSRIGVWRCTQEPGTGTTTMTTIAGSASGNGLAVVEIHPDASGNDHENLNGEYVTFENRGTTTLDLSGWTVSDGDGHTYVVPDGFKIVPGERFRLYTGMGTDTGRNLYWGSDSAIWNNGGDSVTVSDPSGTVRVNRTY